MTPLEPEQPLSQTKRRIIFLTTVLAFLVLVPALAFYAAGYRLDLENTKQNIKTVGGMYVSASAEDIRIYVDDEPVEDMRIFQQAAYIQNLDAGKHQVHVQGDNIQTWTKDLPVYAHLVTESASFNVPERPQIRLITPWQTTAGAAVVGLEATSTFAFASTTNALFATSSTATSSFSRNSEYTFVSTLFASSSEERTLLAELEAARQSAFQFATTSTSTEPAPTTTTQFRDVVLREEGSEVVAYWLGDEREQPYYYCITYQGASTSEAYGAHVVADLEVEYASATPALASTTPGTRLCRDSIRVDRVGQRVAWFEFFPGSRDLVLLHLDDGLYVVEIDDRAWQNTQLLYPGENLEVLRNGDQILVKDGQYFLEVFTELQ